MVDAKIVKVIGDQDVAAKQKATGELIVEGTASAASVERWGIIREPFWVDGVEITAPAAGAALVTRVVSVAVTGRVFGIHIKADEANAFQLQVNGAVVKSWALAAQGSIDIVLSCPLVNNIPAGSTIKVVNVAVGAAPRVYQASILYDEG